MGVIAVDGIRFHGTLRFWLASDVGWSTFMNMGFCRFSGWVDGLTAQVQKQLAESRARDLGIEVRYLMSNGVDKDKLARQIAADKRITEGSICLLSVVERLYCARRFGATRPARNRVGDGPG